MDLLVKYPWPGNVRELINTVERAIVMTQSTYITAQDLALTPGDGEGKEAPLSMSLPLEELEKITVLDTLRATGGNKSEAARRLGITRRTLHLKLKRYGLM